VVDSVDPGRSYSWRTTDGIDARGSRSVTPLAGGRCEVTVRWHLNPEGLDRLLLPMLKVSLARAAERDLVTLAALAADTHAAVTAQATPALA
jgi:hypothetical protein